MLPEALIPAIDSLRIHCSDIDDANVYVGRAPSAHPPQLENSLGVAWAAAGDRDLFATDREGRPLD